MHLVFALGPWSVDAQVGGTSIFTEPDQLWVGGGVQAPAVADTFALMRVSRFPVTELGVAFGYGGPYMRNLDLTIYVYPPPASAEDPVSAEFAQAVMDIVRYAAQRQPEWSVSVKREEATELELEDGSLLSGMVAEAEYVRSGSTSRSIAYVFLKSGLVMKYRITYDLGGPDELPSHLDSWLRRTASVIDRYPG